MLARYTQTNHLSTDNLSQLNTPENEHFTPDQSETGPTYACPRCSTTLKKAKDYMRHAKQTCYGVEKFSCPDCPKTFTRKHRFANHHKRKHQDRCRAFKCSHVSRAAIVRPELTSLGCGFCGDLVQDGLQSYFRHLVDHFKHQSLFEDWSYNRQLASLLSHPLVYQTWKNICSLPLEDLRWSAAEAKEAILLLEAEPSPMQLANALAALPKLYEALLTSHIDNLGADLVHQERSPALRAHSTPPQQYKDVIDLPRRPTSTLHPSRAPPVSFANDQAQMVCPELMHDQFFDEHDSSHNHPGPHTPLGYDTQPDFGESPYLFGEEESLRYLDTQIRQQYNFMTGSFTAPTGSLYDEPTPYTYPDYLGNSDSTGLSGVVPSLLDPNETKSNHRLSWPLPLRLPEDN